jgi:hypothetical protein
MDKTTIVLIGKLKAGKRGRKGPPESYLDK